MKYDPEEYLVRLKDYIKANLNSAITALNTEKADAITLATISDNAYFLQTLNNTVSNYNPHILIGLDAIDASSDGPGVLKTLTFSVVIIVADTQLDLEIGRRMLRYGRVLEDLLSSGFDKVIPHATFKVNSLVPIALTSVNSNDPYRAIGVQVVTELG